MPVTVVNYAAISGIDLALWDIAGKVHGVPCHQLWGGRVRDFVRLYCHLGGGKMEDFYDTDPADARRFGELAQQAVAAGFTAFKTMAVPETIPLEGNRPINYAEQCAGAMREAVGDDIDIMVDCHSNGVALGYVDAGLSGKEFAKDPEAKQRAIERVPIGQLTTAAKVAFAVAHLCDPRNRQMTGSTLLMDGGLSLR